MRDVFAYPLDGDHRGDLLVAAWACLLGHGLLPVLPLVPLSGLLAAVVARSARGVDEPPSVLADVGGLLRTGVGASLVAVAYAGVPLAYLVVVLGFVSGRPGVEAGSLVVLAAATVGGITLLVAAYLLPVGLAAYATAGSLRAAVDPGRLRRGARSGRYLLGWLAAVVVLDVGGLAAVGLASRGPAGRVVAALVAAYALLVAARLVGRGLAESRVGGADVGAGTPPGASRDAAERPDAAENP